MAPTFYLGEHEGPEFAFLPLAFNPIIALLIEEHSPLDAADDDSLRSLLQLDTIHLDESTEGFFRLFEKVCRRIVSGDLVQCDVARFKASEYEGSLKFGLGDGHVTAEVVEAARGFVNFVASFKARR